MKTSLFSHSIFGLLLIGCEAKEVDDLEGRVDELQTSVELSNAAADVEALATRVTELEAGLSTALSALETLQADHAALEDTNSGLEESLSALEDSHATLAAAHAALEEQVSTLQTEQVTQEWVAEQDALISAELSANTEADTVLSERVTVIEGDYLVSADLDGLASEVWVENQSYASSVDVAANRSDIDVLDGRLTAVEEDYLVSADLDGLASEAWVENQGYGLALDVTENADAIDDLGAALSALEATYLTISDFEATTLSSSETWVVGPSSSADYADLHDALDAAYDLRIHPSATLTLQLEPGTHSYTETITVAHPDGRQLQIIGDTSDPSSVVLGFSGSSALYGLYIGGNGELGQLAGLTVEGDGSDSTIGIGVVNNSFLETSDLIVEDWISYGIYVATGSALELTGDSLEISNCHIGVGVYHGSTAEVDYIHAYDNTYGVLAQFTSHVSFNYGLFENNLEGAQVSWGGSGAGAYAESNDNSTVGFKASHGGVSHLAYSSADNNIYGYLSSASSYIYASTTTATNNSYGYWAGYLSYISAGSTSVSGNSTDYNLSGISSTTGGVISW